MEPDMLAATSKFLRQIIPPVIATLIAAVLIAGFNRAFSTHLTQPRLGGLNAQNTEAPDERVMSRPAAVRPSWAADPIEEPAPVREWQKGGMREAAKDPSGTKTAEAVPAAPPAPAVPRKETRPVEARQPEPRQVESRPVESRQVATRQAHVIATPMTAPPQPMVMAPPVVHAPPPVVMAPAVAAPVVVAAPTVIAAPARQDMPREQMIATEPPMVTVPDRTRPQSQPPQYAEQPAPPAPPRGPIGTIADTLNPATWFARAREFGEKIEAVGNEILPSIRQ
jgi:hypothetical protein